jgi:DNA polymerase-1
LFAYLSGEKKMQEALMSGQDYHGGIAKQVFGKYKDFDDAKDYYRKCAKLIMFCLLYGGGVPKAAKLLKTDVDTAMDFVSAYHARLPGVKAFMTALIREATTKGEIFSPLGRRYTFEPDFAYRAVNYLIQGTAADVMKNGLINTDRVLRKKWGGKPKLLMTVHDELCVEVPLRLHCRELMEDIIRAMQMDSKRLGLPVRLPVEIKIAKTRWSRPTKINLPPSIVGGSPKKKAA